MQANESLKNLKKRALYYLAKREYSFKELIQKILKYAYEIGLSEKECFVVVEELKEKNFQSDERFCESYINSKKNKFGSQRISFDLQQKGIDQYLIDTFISELKIHEDKIASLVWSKKYNSPPANKSEENKQIRFMQSRGFSFEVIKKIIR